MRPGGFTLLLVLSFLSVTFPTLVSQCAAGAHVVVNEVLYDPEGPDAGREFVEIMNCGHAGVNLSGWVLETGNGANPNDWTVEWIGGELDYLEPGGILLIGEEDVAPAPDYVTSLDLQNGPDGVRLTDGTATADVVGWGEPLFEEYYEGEPAIDAPSGSSLARVPDCYDHDDNSVDLLACTSPTPGLRNVLEFDLALAVRHPGRDVFDAGAPVGLACVVRNVGSVSTEGLAVSIELLIDGAGSPVSSHPLDRPLLPRDSLATTVVWDEPTVGYHASTARLTFAPDADPASNEAQTTFNVGRLGHHVVINEIMHSPNEGGTEWVELVNTRDDSTCVLEWQLGDDVDANSVVPGGETSRPTIVGPGALLIVAKDPDKVGGVASSPIVTTDGWEALSNEDTVVLLDGYGTPIDRVSYGKDWGGDRGVSLERVRPSMASDDVSNWGSCVLPEGSSPGRENSIYVDLLPASGRLAVMPNPFSPNADGRDDRAIVRLELPIPTAVARVRAFDLKGRVRAVLLDQAAVANRHELIWDGTGTDGLPLSSGLYVLCLEALNAREGVLVNAKVAVGIVR
jgi:hypothetical protein